MLCPVASQIILPAIHKCLLVVAAVELMVVLRLKLQDRIV